MDAITIYRPNLGPVNITSMPIRGQYLSRKKWQPSERAFWGADLYRGEKHLVRPTLAQAAFLTGAGSVTSVWWALRREEYRDEIMSGLLPLVPARAVKASGLDELVDFIHRKGLEPMTVLDAACAVEAAE
jgi:hypothetical protein